jgi:hypothetical protein
VHVDIEASGDLRVPRAEALLVLRGILRRLLPPGAGGTVRLRAREGRIELDYSAPAEPVPAHVPASGRSDRHLGLTLIGRFARHLDWRLDEESAGPGVRRVVVLLPASEAADGSGASTPSAQDRRGRHD